MAKKLNRCALVPMLVLFLSGCISSSKKMPAPVEEAKSNTDQMVPPIPSVSSMLFVPTQANQIKYQDQGSHLIPRVHHYDWNATIQLMVGKMLQEQGVIVGSVLLVDSVNNRTNGSINVGEATERLRNVLAHNGKFMLVTPKQLSATKQQFSLSPQDSLGSRSKAIGIARGVGAQYVLYSDAIGNVSSPSLQMQLMLVQTGEIIWSGKDGVMQF